MEWKNDTELFALLRDTLYTPVVGDILDTLGLYHQFLPQPIQPMREDMILAGRAMPVLISATIGPQPQPFGKLTEALDQLQPGEVYLATGGNPDCAAWGELMTAAARVRGAAGALLDGYHRDTPQVLAQNWPVFSRGRYAQDAAVRASVVDYRLPVEIGRVLVRPGDLVFADLDGALIVPREREAEVIALALAKARTEKTARREIESGITATATFQKHGIL